MFETYSKNHIAAEQRIDSGVLRKFGKAPRGTELLYACKWVWPFQQINFNITTATPKRLSCVGNILLYIYQVMPDNPPDSKTIADELAIGDSFFIDEAITELIRIGALETDQTGRIAITEMGCEYHTRGQIPGRSRKQKVSLCFDTVKHEFPDQSLFPESDQVGKQVNNSRCIVPNYNSADAKRIDLDTIRRAASSQGLLSGEDVLVTHAEPDEVDTEAGIFFKAVYLLVFVDDNEKVTLRIHDPQSKFTSKWFQQAIDDCLKKDAIDFLYLFGSLAADTAAGVGTNGDLDGLTPIPVHEVPKKILTVVKQADRSLFMHTLGFGDNINGHKDGLWNAIYEAADRGVV